MTLSLLIVFLTLVALAIIHEFGHFIIAKRFGVAVEEFGICYPPRIFGKKIGETFYSLNLLPFGAFVKIRGEREALEDSRSFRAKSVGQRALITLGGVLSFWVVAIVLLSMIFMIGAPVGISDEAEVDTSEVRIVLVASDSPAQAAGLKAGDIIIRGKTRLSDIIINRVDQVQELINNNLEQEIILTIKRGQEVLNIDLLPRSQPPQGQGAIGVSLVRTTIKQYPFYLAPLEGIKACFSLTYRVVSSLGYVFGNIFQRKGLPAGVELVGPIGVGSLMSQAIESGVLYYLQFVAIVAVHLAVFNLLPIPAVDGGKLLFLTIEKVKKSPINPKAEEKVNAFFFILLVILMFFVTIRDIIRIF